MNTHPFATLGPDQVLDAVESLGLVSDARVLALNSYENRVYQVGIEDGEPLIAKFYRPQRWSDAAIREEHAFTEELAEAEVQWWRHCAAMARACSSTAAFVSRCFRAGAVARRSRAIWTSCIASASCLVACMPSAPAARSANAKR